MTTKHEQGISGGLFSVLGETLAIATRPAQILVEALSGWRDLRRLESLDDHLLADIGLARHDLIEAGSRGWRENPMRILERSRGSR